MSQAIKRLWSDDQGAELTEYSLVIGVVAMGAIAVLGLFRDAIGNFFNRLVATLDGLNP